MHETSAPGVSRFAALTAIGGGLIAAAARPAFAQSALPTVRIGAQALDATGEAFYGADAGIWQQNGINPDVKLLPNGATIVNAVVGGDLDVGEANTMTIAVAMSRGIPLQALAPAVLYSKRDANANLVVAKNSPLKSPKDLAGTTLGVGSIGDFNHISTLAWLDANGVNPKSVKIVELPFGEVGQALESNRVQASFITEPFKSKAVAAGQIRDFGDTYLAVAPELAVVVWFATRAWVKNNPDTAKKFIAGIYATGKYANTHYPETGASLAKAAKLEPAVIATMKRLYYATGPDKKYIEPILQVANKYGGLQRPIGYDEFMGLSG